MGERICRHDHHNLLRNITRSPLAFSICHQNVKTSPDQCSKGDAFVGRASSMMWIEKRWHHTFDRLAYAPQRLSLPQPSATTLCRPIFFEKSPCPVAGHLCRIA